MSLVTFTLAAVMAQSGTDYPHRDWGKVAYLNMTAPEAATCIARELGRSSDTAIVPAENGSDIDVTPRVAWGKKHEPWQTFKVRSEGVTTLRIFYRHPLRSGRNDKDMRRLRRACLIVDRIEPGYANK